VGIRPLAGARGYVPTQSPKAKGDWYKAKPAGSADSALTAGDPTHLSRDPLLATSHQRYLSVTAPSEACDKLRVLGETPCVARGFFGSTPSGGLQLLGGMSSEISCCTASIEIGSPFLITAIGPPVAASGVCAHHKTMAAAGESSIGDESDFLAESLAP